MGLDTTHDCWHGPYSSFMRWRTEVAKAVGIDLRAMEGFGGRTKWKALKPDTLHVLLNHSDCDGKIKAADCRPLAFRLAKVLPLLPAIDDTVYGKYYLRDKTRQFIKGLRLAARYREDVEFR